MRRTFVVSSVGFALIIAMAATAQAATVRTGGADGTDDKVTDHA